MRKVQVGARVLLGLIYFVFGGMGLAMAFGLMPMPEAPPMSQAAEDFMKGMMGTGYFFPFLKLTETVFGLLLLLGAAVPLALVVLAPVTLHIILYHLYLSAGIGEQILPVAMGLFHILAMAAYWDLYKPLFFRKRR